MFVCDLMMFGLVVLFVERMKSCVFDDGLHIGDVDIFRG
jgi:hypothetical protein